jgi:UDP-N-acetylmuramoylalanine--D-glutamate ligase
LKPGIELDGQRVLVVGLAKTAVATALFCAARGAHVTVTEERARQAFQDAERALRDAGVALEFGGHAPELFAQQDLIVPSPGVPADVPALQAARQHGIRIWSEIELAWCFLRGRVVAITGSNGKTTTTTLVAHILGTAGSRVLLGGNIGTPLISLVDQSSDETITVAEVSSFQLELVEDFRPGVAVLLNLTPDHLDRHKTFAEYGRVKQRLFEKQQPDDCAILNADDPAVAQFSPAGPQIFWFSRQKRVAAGAFVRDGRIVFRQDGVEEVLLRCEEVPLRGAHNLENVLAACVAARLAGAQASAVADGVRSFAGVEHRLEFVAEIAGVSFYNDSKATNVDATLKAIEAFSTPILIILGGKDKAGDYTVLREPLRRGARLALLIGSAAEKIATELGDALPVVRAGTLETAVTMAFERARPGDTVLLAPACASFDQFQNFEHRGRAYKQLVRDLHQGAAASAPVRKG